MQKAIILFSFALMSASCGKDREVPADVAPAPQVAPAKAVASEPEVSGAQNVRLAGATVVLDFEHKVVFDKAVQTNGVAQRKVFVEATRSTPEEVQASIIAALSKSGFSLKSTSPSKGGNRLDFQGADKRKIVVHVRPRLAKGQVADVAQPVGIALFTARE